MGGIFEGVGDPVQGVLEPVRISTVWNSNATLARYFL
jgi:hypothetical protein